MKPDAPLIMVFHGYGSRNIPSINYGFHPVADKEGFAVCYPKGPKDHKGKEYWSVGYQFTIDKGEMRDDTGMAVRLVKHLQKSYGLSKHNVFATGHSNGGAMSHMLAYKASDTFAAVASVSGHIMECTYRTLDTRRPAPLMEVHGTLDPLSRWNGDPFNNDGWGSDIAIPLAVGLSAAAHRCTHEETEVLPLRRNKVIAHRFVNGKDGNQVWFYEVVEGKHSWADQDLDTPSEIWKFFSMYLK
jgi:polyhydroxybutyrate depolymerase